MIDRDLLCCLAALPSRQRAPFSRAERAFSRAAPLLAFAPRPIVSLGAAGSRAFRHAMLITIFPSGWITWMAYRMSFIWGADGRSRSSTRGRPRAVTSSRQAVSVYVMPLAHRSKFGNRARLNHSLIEDSMPGPEFVCAQVADGRPLGRPVAGETRPRVLVRPGVVTSGCRCKKDDRSSPTVGAFPQLRGRRRRRCVPRAGELRIEMGHHVPAEGDVPALVDYVCLVVDLPQDLRHLFVAADLVNCRKSTLFPRRSGVEANMYRSRSSGSFAAASGIAAVGVDLADVVEAELGEETTCGRSPPR